MANKKATAANKVEVKTETEAEVEKFDQNVDGETLKISALLAELIGTFLLVGAVVKLASQGTLGAAAISFILVLLIMVFGPMSGAHLNPAISIALAINKKVSWIKAIAYIIAQVLGAAIALGVFYGSYKAGLDSTLTAGLLGNGVTQSVIDKAGGAVKYIASMVASSNGQYTEKSIYTQLGVSDFINVTVQKSVIWLTLGLEVLGSAIFGLGVGHAVYAEDKPMWETGFSVGFGLFAALMLGGATVVGNPAVALAIGAFETKGSLIWPGYVIYILGTCLGMYIGITAYRFLREKALAK